MIQRANQLNKQFMLMKSFFFFSSEHFLFLLPESFMQNKTRNNIYPFSTIQ